MHITLYAEIQSMFPLVVINLSCARVFQLNSSGYLSSSSCRPNVRLKVEIDKQGKNRCGVENERPLHPQWKCTTNVDGLSGMIHSSHKLYLVIHKNQRLNTHTNPLQPIA